MAAVIWNTADKSANITLSGGSLVATTISATQGAVRTTTSFASGKLYYEATFSNLTGTLWSIGWANATASLAAALGSNTNSVVYQPNQTGRGFFNNATLGADFAPSVSDVVSIAFDIGGKLIWFRVNGGAWNNSASADPASGTGGRSLSTIAAGPYFPIFGDNGSGGAVLANFGATAFRQAIPSGFSAVDSNTQAYNESTKFLGYAVEGPFPSAANASKLLGYGVEGPFPSAVSASKLLGYAILGTKPFLDQLWPNPRPWPRRFVDAAGSWGSNPANIPPAPLPFIPQTFDRVAPARRVLTDLPPSRDLSSLAGTPFVPVAFDRVTPSRRYLTDLYPYRIPSSPVGTPFFTSALPEPRRRQRYAGPARDFGLMPPPSPTTTPSFAYLLLGSL